MDLIQIFIPIININIILKFVFIPIILPINNHFYIKLLIQKVLLFLCQQTYKIFWKALQFPHISGSKITVSLVNRQFSRNYGIFEPTQILFKYFQPFLRNTLFLINKLPFQRKFISHYFLELVFLWTIYLP